MALTDTRRKRHQFREERTRPLEPSWAHRGPHVHSCTGSSSTAAFSVLARRRSAGHKWGPLILSAFRTPWELPALAVQITNLPSYTNNHRCSETPVRRQGNHTTTTAEPRPKSKTVSMGTRLDSGRTRQLSWTRNHPKKGLAGEATPHSKANPLGNTGQSAAQTRDRQEESPGINPSMTPICVEENSRPVQRGCGGAPYFCSRAPNAYPCLAVRAAPLRTAEAQHAATYTSSIAGAFFMLGDFRTLRVRALGK